MRRFSRALATWRDLGGVWRGGWRGRGILLGTAVIVALIWFMPIQYTMNLLKW